MVVHFGTAWQRSFCCDTHLSFAATQGNLRKLRKIKQTFARAICTKGGKIKKKCPKTGEKIYKMHKNNWYISLHY